MILITGGAGYIGSTVTWQVRKAGRDHLVLDSLAKGTEAAVGASKLVKVDLLDPEALDEVFASHQISSVIHMAARVSVTESIQNPQLYFDVNTLGTANLLASMKNAGVGQLVFSSTAAVYGAPQYLPIDELHPRSHTNPYGESKYLAEDLIRQAQAEGWLTAVTFRYFNAAGAVPESNLGPSLGLKEDLISIVIRVMQGLQPSLSIFGEDYDTRDGTCIRDFIHVKDLAAAHMKAVEYLENKGESVVLNLGSETGYTVKEIIQSLEKISGQTVPVVKAERRAGDPVEVVSTSQLAQKTLKWKPQHSTLDEMLADVWAYHEMRKAVSL